VARPIEEDLDRFQPDPPGELRRGFLAGEDLLGPPLLPGADDWKQGVDLNPSVSAEPGAEGSDGFGTIQPQSPLQPLEPLQPRTDPIGLDDAPAAFERFQP
jgi:hypothetical protein